MTPQEAISGLNYLCKGISNLDTLEAITQGINALKKQIPKKPTPQVVKGGKRLIGNGWWCKGTTVYKCPCCNSWITQTYKYCIDCGQALDWSDTNDRT